ncbi:PASTA domain-containing protein [Natrialba sp. SSL1]|uniref:PASTA domain-containing protein n=1 Tax=Natrialba sp. SSL1 TaxID=1869245 RepID=UPI0008F8C446|nr:PASTA domain-containing protein [Natrialba sp. SSL1]OIB56610.1 hypothetical protein BBD46_16610 [Natrialba sp. SSL1]
MSSCSHAHATANEYAIEDRGRADPTQTTTDQRALSRWIRGRIGEVDAAIREKILEDDAFGMDDNAFSEWSGLSDAEKARRFDDWLERQIESTILTSEFEDKAERHLEHAVERGATDAHRELRDAGVDIGDPDETLAQDNVQEAIGLGVIALAGRVRSEMDDFRGDAREIITDGGLEVSRTQLASDIVERGQVYKSEVTADTAAEVVNQYNTTGQLSSYERVPDEVEVELNVEPEFRTAQDDRVCEQCQELAQRDWTLEDAQDFHIPRDTHPHCRCRWEVTDVRTLEDL